MFAALPNQSPLLTTTSRLAWIHGGVKHSRKKCDLFSLDLQDKLILLFSLELSMKFFFKIQLLFLYLHSFVIFHSPWNACVKKRRIQTRTVGVWEKTVQKGCGFLATFNGRRQKIKHTVKTTRNLINKKNSTSWNHSWKLDNAMMTYVKIRHFKQSSLAGSILFLLSYLPFIQL